MLDVVVLASGRGSNFAALVAAQQRKELPIRLRALLSDKANARALDIATGAGIEAMALSPRAFADRAAFDAALFARVAQYAPALIVLTGYMRVIDAAAIAPWRGKVINIHPSLLPKYPGLHTYQRALDAGDAVHGASVHFVTAELDGGPVIAQVQLPVLPGDSAESLATRLLPLEHRLLVATVDMLAQGRVELGDDGVLVDGRAVERPMRLHDGRTLAVDDARDAQSSAGCDPALAAN
jgi:phosphoribosylglycinamide formyltransferase 1